MKKFFLLVSCIVIGASLLAQPKVEHLGALQGENVGQDGIFRLRAKDAVGSADFGWRDLTPGMVYDARPEEVAAYGKAEQEEAVKTIAEFAENVVGIKEANYKERTFTVLPGKNKFRR